MYDLIIIGGGAAGVTSAVYSVRKKMDLNLYYWPARNKI